MVVVEHRALRVPELLPLALLLCAQVSGDFHGAADAVDALGVKGGWVGGWVAKGG